MAQLEIQRGNGGSARAIPGSLQTSPAQYLRELMRMDPFSELMPMTGFSPMMEGWSPFFEVTETPQAFVFRADLPGVTEKDLEISNAHYRLTIAGHRHEEREEQGDTWYVAERRQGSFSRAFTLPPEADVDHVNASLEHGVLTVTVPRLPEAKGVKKIAVKVAKK